ncbi:MAG: YbjQ family protein [Anaerolineae bacterium]|nr:YbjQ family protein [Anaerolineae bacterium]
MFVTTGNEIEGYHIGQYMGVVRGIVVRSPTITQGLLGGLNQIVGGNIEAFTEVCEHAREEAYERMVYHAQQMGADAIIGMRYDATQFSETATEVLCYGTAVKLRKPGA